MVRNEFAGCGPGSSDAKGQNWLPLTGPVSHTDLIGPWPRQITQFGRSTGVSVTLATELPYKAAEPGALANW